jgi:hypothetical protein
MDVGVEFACKIRNTDMTKLQNANLYNTVRG